MFRFCQSIGSQAIAGGRWLFGGVVVGAVPHVGDPITGFLHKTT
jgi:hypothetical protein